MKKKVLILLMIMPIINYVHAQDFDKDGNIGKIVESKFNKEKLFSNAKLWIGDYFSNYKYAMDYEDKDAGIISVSGNVVIYTTTPTYILGVEISNTLNMKFKLIIECKDAKYRYTIKDIHFRLSGTNDEEFYNNSVKERDETIQTEQVITDSLENKIKNLYNIDSSRFNKKEMKEYQATISSKENDLRNSKNTLDTDLSNSKKENDALLGIQLSLEKEMSVDNSF